MTRRAGFILALILAMASLLGSGAYALAHDHSDHASADRGQNERKSDTQSKHSESADDEHSESADDEHSSNDSASQQHSSDAVSCERGKYSAWDEQWLMSSIQGDRFEIRGGQIAQDNAAAQIVRDLGARVKTDHTKSLQDAVAVAQELGIDVPDSPTPSQQWELRVVAHFHGNEFDRWYSDLEVQDHIQDIEEAQAEVDKGCNPKVRQNAKDDLPVLKEHLRLAKAALAAVGGPVDGGTTRRR
jgi:putative membrane protein